MRPGFGNTLVLQSFEEKTCAAEANKKYGDKDLSKHIGDQTSSSILHGDTAVTVLDYPDGAKTIHALEVAATIHAVSARRRLLRLVNKRIQARDKSTHQTARVMLTNYENDGTDNPFNTQVENIRNRMQQEEISHDE